MIIFLFSESLEVDMLQCHQPAGSWVTLSWTHSKTKTKQGRAFTNAHSIGHKGKQSLYWSRKDWRERTACGRAQTICLSQPATGLYSGNRYGGRNPEDCEECPGAGTALAPLPLCTLLSTGHPCFGHCSSRELLRGPCAGSTVSQGLWRVPGGSPETLPAP